MGLTLSSAEEDKLYSHIQFCDCRFVSFSVYKQKAITSFTPGAYTFLDMIQIYPRHSWVALDASIVLYGDQSKTQAGAACAGHTWSLAGNGSIATDGDECTYTAPASGTGEAVIKLVTTGNAVGSYARVAYGEVGVNVGHVTSFHADIDSGGWEMKIRAYGDCTGLGRGAGILLVANDYWNGSEDTFGGYRWAHGVFYGYVDRVRHLHQDAEIAYVEVDLISPITTLNLSECCDLFFSKADTGVEIVMAAFLVRDAVWWVLHESEFNQRHNCTFHYDAVTVANLKLSRGPIGDVIRDVGGRTYSPFYSTRVGDLRMIPDPDVRSGDAYWAGVFGDALRFAISSENVESWDVLSEAVDTPGAAPSPDNPTISQVVVTAIKSDLSEITGKWPAAHPGYGKRVEVGGLIASTQAVVDAWAAALWWKLQPQRRLNIRMFLMHHIDLYMFLSVTFSIRTADIDVTGYVSPDNNSYVTNIDYEIDPGFGTWRGGISLVSQSKA